MIKALPIVLLVLASWVSQVQAACFYNGIPYPTGTRIGSYVCMADGTWRIVRRHTTRNLIRPFAQSSEGVPVSPEKSDSWGSSSNPPKISAEDRLSRGFRVYVASQTARQDLRVHLADYGTPSITVGMPPLVRGEENVSGSFL